ncbi:MAG: ATP-binding cassette domain-containing protein [Candidatus Marinimicrobia bacterium]|nr:ATP-binding cassette domain-containing protein [Candidatus Neomarinimicrobiota bacterium]
MSFILPALSHRYQGNKDFLLNTPELSLSATGYTCIIGENGSGKSTFGEALATKPSHANTAQWYYLPQYPDRFLFAENVIDQLSIMLSKRIDTELLLHMMNELGFKNAKQILDFPFILMSGGERRRIALVCIFYLQPEFLILDEPDIGITEKENVVLLRIIGNLKANETRIILISHNYEFVSGSTDLICLKAGTVDRIGKTNDLLNEADFDLSDYGVRFQAGKK